MKRTQAVSESRRQRQMAETANRRSAEALRRAAHALVDAGISYRDAARIMGVSHQRIAQLV